ncbi:ATPase, AAA family [Luminiphilus syltensis NOR5-1B]|uniref:ATPase, AAA family n=1 Tax=Luminiphilus syltensis NOR5-1B TaxID=565045 RepID=B8KST2_9GAMM|nr:MoxR family ATPase [Luminiphilus syltensis]EED34116.1 ATPase, AAA family [Luminiphilus syltensis NOR5-1B]
MIISQYPGLGDIDTITDNFEQAGYICTRRIATVVYLAAALNKPILVEGPPGVGKTELAKTCASVVARPLVRLQCYEGLDEAKALYEWKYGKQLLYTQVLKQQLAEILSGAVGLRDSMQRLHEFGDVFYSPEFLEPRPLLRALEQPDGAVLLIDEVDKADFEFESLLLEVLSDFQVSIPEIGTIEAKSKPIVFLTSNDTRDLSDALKRRCLHLHIPFPSLELERQIVTQRVPNASATLTDQLVRFVHAVRELDLKKAPAISESIDWAKALLLLHADQLDTHLVHDTLNVLLKYEEDVATAEGSLHKLLGPAVR